MDDKFRDFIPEGDNPGAIGDSGFQDFVPAPTPKPQVITEPVVEVREEIQQQPEVIPQEPIVPPLEPQREENQ